MSDKLREAAQAVLDWLESTKTQSMEEYLQVIDSLKAALAEPEQKPMLEMNPEKRSWVGLTHQERYLDDGRTAEEIEYAKAIEAKLREKNT